MMETAIRTTKTWDGLNCEMVVAGKIAELQLQKCCPQCGELRLRITETVLRAHAPGVT
jgi:hypothetical protein